MKLWGDCEAMAGIPQSIQAETKEMQDYLARYSSANLCILVRSTPALNTIASKVPYPRTTPIASAEEEAEEEL